MTDGGEHAADEGPAVDVDEADLGDGAEADLPDADEADLADGPDATDEPAVESPDFGGGHDHGPDRAARTRALWIALVVNTAFLVVEVVGAYFANSLALLADAAHMLTDSLSISLALVAAYVAARPADRQRTYGYHRAEVLGGLLNGLFLLVVVGYIVWDAVGRLADPRAVDAPILIVVGLLGLGANLVGAWVLHGGRDELNVRGAYLHLLADALGSVVAVLVGVSLLVADIPILDPIGALVIAALILYSTKGLLADAANILLQGVPRDVDVDAIVDHLAGMEGVEDVHDIHVWALSSSTYALSAHLVVSEAVDPDAVLGDCQAELGREFQIDHATLQIESPEYSHTVDLDCYGAGTGG